MTGNSSISYPKSTQAAEAVLTKWGIRFTRNPDETLTVPGDILLSGWELGKLPDLSRVHVQGTFDCTGNLLTTLEGAPASAHHFICNANALRSLKHAPAQVQGSFLCFHNNLASLEHAPQYVGGNFNCGFNPLETLLGGPRKVGGNYGCMNARLVTLEGMAAEVGGNIDCSMNGRLRKFDYVPSGFKLLTSDYGTFNRIPAEMKSTPAELVQQRRRNVHDAFASGLAGDMTAPPRAVFRKQNPVQKHPQN